MNTQSRLLMNNTPPMSGPGSMQLWFATSICLDSDSGNQPNEWFNLEGEYIEFGTANQASFSVEAWRSRMVGCSCATLGSRPAGCPDLQS